ncbi:MAG TPA: FAD-binding oxidoreductase [Rhizomicrobium sp.]|nr:FAD-binding oxidoreductase [Rhizomicrobium sp.]
MAGISALSRRAFLATASATALALPATAKPLARRAPLPRAPLPRAPSHNAWAELARRLRGPVVRPWDPDYYRLALPDNLRYATTLPEGIARCMSDEDVAAAIGWSRENEIPLITRSGGHSYAGYSTTTGLMIDMKLMHRIAFDGASGIVTLAGGAINDHVYEALAANNVTITHGRCPSVGAAAFLLGGGIGFNMREYGLACDQVVATRLVKADGGLVEMKRGDNDPFRRELFWACQGGGGGNFGISTSFSMKTIPVAPGDITVFKIQWTSRPEEVAAALMRTLEGAPSKLGSRVSLGAVTPEQLRAGKDVTVNLLGQYKGPEAEFLDIMKPVYAVAAPDNAAIEEMPYWEAQETFLAEPPDPTFYQERSAFMVDRISDAAIKAGFRHLREWPGTTGYCDLRFFQTGDAVNNVGPTDTAFVHRGNQWLMVVGLYWGCADDFNKRKMAANHAWQNDFYRAMLPYCGGGAYQNFPDPSLLDWRRSYYGENLKRLVDIKTAVDPTRVFNFPQAI